MTNIRQMTIEELKEELGKHTDNEFVRIVVMPPDAFSDPTICIRPTIHHRRNGVDIWVQRVD